MDDLEDFGLIPLGFHLKSVRITLDGVRFSGQRGVFQIIEMPFL